MRVEKTVFISYRHTNSAWALAIFKDLKAHGYDVFFDVEGIGSGDFERVIMENIRSRAHFLVVLTPSALEDSSRPDHWLRREIEEALNTQRNIVPLMFEGFDFSTPTIANHLTGTIATLTRYNALVVPRGYFDEAMGRLRERYLNKPLELVLHPHSQVAGDFARRQQDAATAAPAVEKQELTAQEYFEQASNAADPNEKIRLLSRAIDLKPDYYPAFNERGIFRAQQGDVAGAREDYDTAIRLRPDVALGFYARGFLRQQQGDLAGAREDYDTAIRLDPHDTQLFINRSAVRSDQGDLVGALEDYRTAARLSGSERDETNANNLLLNVATASPTGTAQTVSSLIRVTLWNALAAHGCVYLEPNIPERKRRNAITTYAPQVNARDVVLLYDSTVFGSAKHGLLLTESAIFWRNHLEYPQVVAFKDVKSVARESDCITLNGHIINFLSGHREPVIRAVGAFLTTLAEQNRG